MTPLWPLLLLVCSAHSQELTHATLDAAGGRSTGDAITNDATLGAIGSGHDDAPGLASRPGFAGQLHDAVQLTVQPAPAAVAEESTRAFTATAVCDDATTFPATSVLWDNGGSPFYTVSPAGLVTAGAVPAETADALQVRWGELAGTVPLTIHDSVPDNYGPFAGDGLDDAWQQTYFSDAPASAQPGDDPDNDGQDNALEFLAGTTPLDGGSRLQVRMEPVPGDPNSRRLLFSPWRPDRTYQWDFSLTLQPAWQPLPDAPVTPAPDNEGQATDDDAGTGRKFYRLRIQ